MNKGYKKKYGFTLVELLVVVSIIGILSSLAVLQLNDARKKGRDAVRKADMTQLRTAIYLYFDDEGIYPSCGVWDSGTADFGATENCYNNVLTNALIPVTGDRPYINGMPVDPKNPTNEISTNATYLYRYVSNGDEYALVYHLEITDQEVVIRGW